MTQDEDVMRIWSKAMAERGWFVTVNASRVGEHFEVKEVPPVGWALKWIDYQRIQDAPAK